MAAYCCCRYRAPRVLALATTLAVSTACAEPLSPRHLIADASTHGSVASVTVSLDAATITAGSTTMAKGVVRDAANHALSGYTVSWTSSNPAVASVNPTGIVAGVSAGTANIIATSEGVSGQAVITVVAAPAVTQMTIVTQPSGAVSGSPLTVQPVIQVRDANGNIAAGYGGIVTASVASGNGVIHRQVAVVAMRGVAAFTGMLLTGCGAQTLRFDAADIAASVTSAGFTVTGDASKLRVASQPTSAISGQAFSPALVVRVLDACDAVVSSSTADVTAAVATGTGTLVGANPVRAANGIASFTELAVSGSGPHTLRVASAGLSSATTTSFEVTSVTPPPPPPPPPGGIGNLASHDFEDGTLGVYYTNSGPDVVVVSDPSGVRGGKVVSISYVDAGPLADINKSIKFDPVHRGLGSTFFFRGYLYFPPGTVEFENPQVQRKLLYWQGGLNNEFHFILDMRAGSDGLYVVYSDGTRSGGAGGPTPDTYINSGPIRTGVWYLIETEVRLNSTRTSQDGVIRVWVDNSLKFEKTNVAFMPINGSYTGSVNWRTWVVGQQREGRDWNGGAPELNIFERRYWDNVAFGTTRLGP
jgi:hypothetical protein